jgi:BolA family transcriptional regulator, general stress-responsive regulator
MKNIIEQKLTQALAPLVLEILDESHKHAGHAGARPGGNSHFKVKIVSSAFTPLSRLERHRFIHELLKDELNDQIHALSLILLAPEEVPHDA